MSELEEKKGEGMYPIRESSIYIGFILSDIKFKIFKIYIFNFYDIFK